jgi:hypothetical protein
MLIDSEKITDFRIDKKKDITFDINGKEVVFEIPYIVCVNPQFKKIYVGGIFETGVDLSDEDIEAILNGDESVIESSCARFAWEQITENKFCKK